MYITMKRKCNGDVVLIARSHINAKDPEKIRNKEQNENVSAGENVSMLL